MTWIVIAAVGIAVGLTIVFWQKIVTWANQKVAGWLAEQFGSEVRDAFLLLLAGTDRTVVLGQRAAVLVQERLTSARILFQQVRGEYKTVVQAEMKQDDGEIIELEAAEVIPWHELPDEVREKFIRRQSASVEMELKLKE